MKRVRPIGGVTGGERKKGGMRGSAGRTICRGRDAPGHATLSGSYLSRAHADGKKFAHAFTQKLMRMIQHGSLARRINVYTPPFDPFYAVSQFRRVSFSRISYSSVSNVTAR